MSRKWIVMDLDGTLCDISHRVHLAQAKQWDAFHDGILADKVREDAREFLSVMAKHYKIAFLTGRNERYRGVTVRWLNDNGLYYCCDLLLMRPDDNRDPDHELKLRLLDGAFHTREAALENVLLILDDRDKVVEAFRNAGFNCWQVTAGLY